MRPDASFDDGLSLLAFRTLHNILLFRVELGEFETAQRQLQRMRPIHAAHSGWLDLVMLKHAVRLNTCTELAITKLDVLSPLAEIKVCVAYEGENGERYEHVPYHQSVLHKVRPIYETLAGWQVDVEKAERIEDLPPAAREYVQFIEQYTGVHVSFVSVGPARDQCVVLPRAA